MVIEAISMGGGVQQLESVVVINDSDMTLLCSTVSIQATKQNCMVGPSFLVTYARVTLM